MTSNEFRKLLEGLGCTFRDATKHYKVYFGEKMTTLPRHGRADIGP